MKVSSSIVVAAMFVFGGQHAFSQESSSETPPASQDQVGEAPAQDSMKAKTPDEAEAPVAAKSGASLFGDLRIGPTASLAFPHLLYYSLDATYAKFIGLSLGGGRLGRKFNDTTELEMRNWDIRVRWFPFSGSYFLGAAYGNQGVVLKTRTDLKNTQGELELKIPTDIRLEVTTKYLTPHMGWFATWESGFTLGFEFGYQMALNSSADFDVVFQDVSPTNRATVENTAEFKKSKSDIEKTAELFGKTSIPYINLLRLGWLL
jgi:hypothetical protein